MKEKLPLQAEHFQLILEGISDIIIVLNINGNIVYKSPSLEKALGYKTDHFMGTNILEFIYPDDGPELISSINSALQNLGVVKSTNSRFRHSDGSWDQFEILIRGFEHSSNKKYIVMDCHDITDSLHMREEINKFSEKIEKKVSEGGKEWEATFDAIPDLISIHDLDFRIKKANRAFYEKFGIDKKDVIYRRCYEIFHDKTNPWKSCPFTKTLETGKTSIQEVEDPHLGGVYSISTSPIFHEGAIIGVIHVARDITKYKRIEKELNDSMEAVEVRKRVIKKHLKEEQELKKLIEKLKMEIWKLKIKIVENEDSIEPKDDMDE